jgi:hypothetical protein
MIRIIPKGEKFNAVYKNKKQKWIAEDDLIVMYKGKLLELQQKANDNVLDK